MSKNIARKNYESVSPFAMNPFDLDNPIKSLREMRNRENALFGMPLFLGFPENGSMVRFMKSSMKCDVAETDEQYEIKADLPGIDKNDVDVSFDDGVLSIVYENDSTKSDEDEKDSKWKVRERSFTSCRREFALPEADAENIKAVMADGVLTVTVGKEKKEETKKSISID